MEHTFKFSVSHAADGAFDGGLRDFFQYRDLGMKEATAGRVVAHVIRAVPGKHAVPQRHHHHDPFCQKFPASFLLNFFMEQIKCYLQRPLH